MEIRPDKPYTAVVALKVASLLPLSSSHFTLCFDAGRIQNQVSQLDLELRRCGHRHAPPHAAQPPSPAHVRAILTDESRSNGLEFIQPGSISAKLSLSPPVLHESPWGS
jgi:hypothetical protein